MRSDERLNPGMVAKLFTDFVHKCVCNRRRIALERLT